ncbi:MAG: hypothetical protein K9L73_04070 [Spirochaetia bacterium]|nr:hypothetical protein [Spirochaetia bacterium]
MRTSFFRWVSVLLLIMICSLCISCDLLATYEPTDVEILRTVTAFGSLLEDIPIFEDTGDLPQGVSVVVNDLDTTITFDHALIIQDGQIYLFDGECYLEITSLGSERPILEIALSLRVVSSDLGGTIEIQLEGSQDFLSDEAPVITVYTINGVSWLDEAQAVMDLFWEQ